MYDFSSYILNIFGEIKLISDYYDKIKIIIEKLNTYSKNNIIFYNK